MPVYNGERFLREQIESVLAQTCSDLRLMLWDDDSSDNSVGICQEYAARDERVFFRCNPQNIGLIRTVEQLARTVTGPYFAMCDQDDVWDSDKLAVSIAALEAASAALVYSDVRTVDEYGSVLSESYWLSRGLRPIQNDGPPLLSIYRNPVLGHTIVATQQVALRLGLAPAGIRYYEPWLLSAAHSVGRSRAVERPLGSYRYHAENVVGPAPASPSARLRRLLGSNLRTRQTTRFHALEAVQRYFPDMNRITTLDTGLRARIDAARRLYEALDEERTTMRWPDRTRESVLLAACLGSEAEDRA